MPCHPTHYILYTLFLHIYLLEWTLVLFSPTEAKSTGLLRDLTLAALVPVVNTHSLSHARQLPTSRSRCSTSIPDVTLLSKVRTALFYARCTAITGCFIWNWAVYTFLLELQMIALYYSMLWLTDRQTEPSPQHESPHARVLMMNATSIVLYYAIKARR